MRIRRSISLVLALTMMLSVFAAYNVNVSAEEVADTGVLLFEEDFNYAVDTSLDSLGWETAATYSIQNAKENSTVFEGLALSDTCAQLDAGEGPMAFVMDETYGGSETLWASAIVRANSGMGCISLGMHSNAWSCKDDVERITLGSFPGWMGSPGEGSLSLILQTAGDGPLTEEQINAGTRTIISKSMDMRGQDTLYLIKVEYPNGTSTKVSVWLNPSVAGEPTGEPDISAELAGVVHINTIGTHLGWASAGSAQLDAVRLGTSFRAVLPLAGSYEPPQTEPTEKPAEPTEEPEEDVVDENLLVEEDFDYAEGSLRANNGGKGWANAWDVQGGRDNSYFVRADEPIYFNNLKSSASYAYASNTWDGTGRVFDVYGVCAEYESDDKIGKTGKTLWASALFGVEEQETSFFAFYKKGADQANAGWTFPRVEFGKTDASADKVSMRVIAGSEDDAYAVSAVSNKDVEGEDYLYVIKYEFVSDTSTRISCWLNPTPGTEPTGNPDMTVTTADLACGFDTLGLNLGNANTARFDAFRLGKTYASVTPVGENGSSATTPAPTTNPDATTTPTATVTPNVDEVALVEEDFNYELTGLEGLNGGKGWKNKWEVQNAIKTGYEVKNQAPFKYPGLEFSPTYGSGGTNWVSCGRVMDVDGALSDYKKGDNVGKVGKTIWASILFRIQNTDNSVFMLTPAGIGWLYDSPRIEFGRTNADKGRISMQTVASDDSRLSSVSSVAVDSSDNLYTIKIEFLSEKSTRISCWLNPDVNEGPTGEPDMSITTTDYAVNFRSLMINPGTDPDKGCYDAFRVGPTYRSVLPKLDKRLAVNKVRVYSDELAGMQDLQIAGSNLSQTNGFDILGDISTSAVTDDYVEYSFNNSKIYRYIKIMFYSQSKVKEVKFYNNDTLITGEAFSTTGEDGHDASKAFDGNNDTYYQPNSLQTNYVGLDIGGEVQVAELQFDPAPGRYETEQNVSITTTTQGATIYYTLDGSMPSTTNGTLYTDPIKLVEGSSVVLRAVGIKQGLMDSDVKSAGYGIKMDAPEVHGLKSYSFGNSLTDTFTNGWLSNVASSAGYAHETLRQSVPGAPTEVFIQNPNYGAGVSWGNPSNKQVPDGWLTDDRKGYVGSTVENSKVGEFYDAPPTAFEVFKKIDILTTQPYGSQGRGVSNEVICASILYNEALKHNPDTRYMIYGQWPEKHYDGQNVRDSYGDGSALKSDYPNADITPATNFDEAIDNHYKFYEKMADVMTEKYPNQEKVAVIPAGLALRAYKDAMVAKSIPGYERFDGQSEQDILYSLFSDNGHTSDLGAYIVTLTVFTSMYKQTPYGKVTVKPVDANGVEISDAEAQGIQQLVWDVCRNYEYSSVYGASADEPVPTATAKPSATTTPTAAPTATPATPTPTVVPTIKPTATVVPTAAPAGTLLFEEDFDYDVDTTLDSLGWETAATYSIQNAKENCTMIEGLAVSDTCAQLDAGEGPMAFVMDETYGGSETLWASAIVRANNGMGCISLGMHSNAWSCKDDVERITLGSFPGWMGSPGEGSLSLILQTAGDGPLTEEQINAGTRTIISKSMDMRGQDTLYLIKVEYPNGTSTKVSVWLNPSVAGEPTSEPDISAELAGVIHISTIGTHLGWASAGVAQLDAVRLGTSFRSVLPLIEGYDPEVVAAKKAAVEELQNYKNTNDYRDAQKNELADAIAAGKAAIDAATDVAGVEAAVTASKATMDAIKTDAQLKAEELTVAKDAAKAELDTYKNADDYREAEKEVLAKAIEDAKAAIDAATNTAGVESALTAAKASMDEIKTDADLTAEENAKAEALQKAKDDAKAALDSYKNAADYRDAEKEALAKAIEDAKVAIDAATDVAGVEAAVTAAKTSMDEIKTDAQLTLEEAKAAAIASLESYKNLDDYREAEKAALKAAIDAAKAAINAATDVAGIEAAVTSAKSSIDVIKTDAQLTEEEQQAADNDAVKKVKFKKKKIKMKKGQKKTLKVTLKPSAKKLSKAAKKVKWSINKKGKKVVKFVKKAKKLVGKLKIQVKAAKKGTAKITCKAPSGKKAVCKIIVK